MTSSLDDAQVISINSKSTSIRGATPPHALSHSWLITLMPSCLQNIMYAQDKYTHLSPRRVTSPVGPAHSTRRRAVTTGRSVRPPHMTTLRLSRRATRPSQICFATSKISLIGIGMINHPPPKNITLTQKGPHLGRPWRYSASWITLLIHCTPKKTTKGRQRQEEQACTRPG